MKTILLFTLTAHIALAGTNDNAVSSGTAPVIEPISLKVKAAEACVEKIQTLIAKLDTLHASVADQRPRNECVLQRLNKANAVYELVKNAPAEIARVTDDDPEDAGEHLLHRAALALTRIEILLQEANDCLNLPVPVSKPPRPKTVITDPELLPSTRPNSPTDTSPIPVIKQSRQYIVRQPGDALSQGGFAQLLSQATGSPDTATAAIVNLTQLDIMPPNGWQPERPLNLDDFSVVMTQLLKINVETNSEPRLHYQMLRELGLALDQYFPSYSGKGEVPLLHESEVRRFLAIGLAEGITHPGQPD